MIKLYDEDAYISEFTATVISCEMQRNEYKILLDKTAFFPTAGGQNCDTGTLGGEKVLHVEIHDDKVYHYTNIPFVCGTQVLGKINFCDRFRKMQHHSAEHIISGLVNTLFGFENTGFHLSDKEVTIDYNGVLTDNDITLIEQKANQAVQKNIKINAYYPKKDDLPSLSYRAKLDLADGVRLVEIPGIDLCACCAPHVKRTGEIGLIKLRDMMHHRGGVRIRMICGMDALYDYQAKAHSTLSISNMLSAKQDEVADAVLRTLSELAGKKQKITEMCNALAVLKAEKVSPSAGNICIFDNELDTAGMRTLANHTKDKCGGMLAVLSGNDASGYSYIIVSDRVNLKELAGDINSHLSGRGGGSHTMIQGTFYAKKEDIERYFGKTNV